MPIQTENLNKKLYGLLKAQGYNPVPKDSEGQTTPVPDEADVFQFDFTMEGESFGKVWVTVDSSQNLIIYYDDRVTNSDDESGGKNWTRFLQLMKSWAQRRQLSFELRNQNHLASDMAQRSHMKKKEQISENAKWRQGYSASGHPAGYKHKSGEVGPVGGTFTNEPSGYDGETTKVPVQKHRDKPDELANRDKLKVSTTGKPLQPKNAQKNLKGAIAQSKGKHGPVGVLPEGLADDFADIARNMKNKDGTPRFTTVRQGAAPNKPASSKPTGNAKAPGKVATSPADWYAQASGGRRYTGDSKQPKGTMVEGYYPMGKSASYNDAVPTVKIVLQHTRQIQEGEQRYRNVARIFLENQQGERILCPSNKPGVAQVYARHLAEGGLPHDDRWNHIGSLVEEYSKMAGFVRATRNGQFNESAQQLVNEGINHYNSLRETLGKMRGHRGYQAYFESYTPNLMETDGDETNINELFVQETMDPRIESVMPILSRLHKKVSEMSEVNELSEWADKLIEGDGGQEALNPAGIPESEELDEDATIGDVRDAEDFKERVKNLKKQQMVARKDPNVNFLKLKQALIAKAKAKGIDTSSEELEEDDEAIAHFLAKGGEVKQGKYHKPRKSEKTDYGSKHIGGFGDKMKASRTGTAANTTGSKLVGVSESHMSNVDLIMQELGSGARDIYDVMNNPTTPDEQFAAKQLQSMYDQVATDHRLHPDDDVEQIIDIMGDHIAQEYPADDLEEGKWTVNAKTGAKLDPRTGAEIPGSIKEPKVAAPRAPRVAAPKLTLNDVWRKVENVVGQIYPDGDPIDWLGPWFRKQGIADHKVGDILTRAAQKNGYKDIYDYYNHFGDDLGYVSEGQEDLDAILRIVRK